MRVSPTLTHIALHGIGNEWFVTLLEKCDEQGFDLDDFMFEIWKENFLFEIWKETRND